MAVVGAYGMCQAPRGPSPFSDQDVYPVSCTVGNLYGSFPTLEKLALLPTYADMHKCIILSPQEVHAMYRDRNAGLSTQVIASRAGKSNNLLLQSAKRQPKQKRCCMSVEVTILKICREGIDEIVAAGWNANYYLSLIVCGNPQGYGTRSKSHAIILDRTAKSPNNVTTESIGSHSTMLDYTVPSLISQLLPVLA